MRISMDEFEELASDAVDSIPDQFFDQMDNVIFCVEEEPDAELGPDTFGVYDGVSLLDRADGYGVMGDLPDTITLFKGPHERACSSMAELAEEVRRTVVHEVAHYFGMDEDQVAAMGYE